jgi:hypothetical protein
VWSTKISLGKNLRNQKGKEDMGRPNSKEKTQVSETSNKLKESVAAIF